MESDWKPSLLFATIAEIEQERSVPLRIAVQGDAFLRRAYETGDWYEIYRLCRLADEASVRRFDEVFHRTDAWSECFADRLCELPVEPRPRALLRLLPCPTMAQLVAGVTRRYGEKP